MTNRASVRCRWASERADEASSSGPIAQCNSSAKILEAVDRGNSCGKRDYAIILLITRLGSRGIDVKRLRFADLDWPGNRLSVVQAKTDHRVQLPLLKDVGWAVIDYVRHGRPPSDCPQVFLRHTLATRLMEDGTPVE